MKNKQNRALELLLLVSQILTLDTEDSVEVEKEEPKKTRSLFGEKEPLYTLRFKGYVE